RQFDPGGLIEMQAARFRGDAFNPGVQPVLVIENVAAMRDRISERHVSLADASVAGHQSPAHVEVAGALDFRIDRDGPLPEAGEGGDQFEGGTGSVEALHGAVNPSAIRLNLGEL